MTSTTHLFFCVRDGEVLPIQGDLTTLKYTLAELGEEEVDWGPDEDEAVAKFFSPPLPCVCDLDEIAGSEEPDFGQVVALDLLSVLPLLLNPDLAKRLKPAIDTLARTC